MTDFDGVMRALSDSTRRGILIALRDAEPVHPFSGNGADPERATELHHLHLPFLEDNDLVAWNRDTGAVRRGANFTAVEPILAALDARRATLPEDYLPKEGQIC